MSKYPIIEHLGHDTTSYAVAKITSKYISLFGAPHSIISDNGPQFIGKPYKQLMSRFVSRAILMRADASAEHMK